MASLSYILDLLSEHITMSSVNTEKQVIYRDIAFLEPQIDLDISCIYIGNAQDVASTLREAKNYPDSLTVIYSGHANPRMLPELFNGNFIATDLGVSELYGILHRILRSYWCCDRRLLNTMYEGRCVEALVQEAASILGTPVIMVGKDNQSLCCSTLFSQDNTIIDSVILKGTLPQQIFIELCESKYFSVPGGRCVQKSLSVESAQAEFYAYFSESRDEGYCLVSVCSVRPDGVDPFAVLSICSAYINQTLIQLKERLQINGRERAFELFLDDILGGKLSDDESIAERFSSLGLNRSGSSNYRCVLVESHCGMTMQSQRQLLEALECIFPGSHMTIYRGRIVIMYPHTTRSLRLTSVNLDAFDTLLKQYGCRAVISTCAPLSGYRIQYMLCLKALKLDAVLNRGNDRSYFYYELYQSEVIIDFCAEKFMETCREKDIMYLASPAIYILMEYDRAHHSNLRGILYQYLINNKNFDRTAAAAFVHKNTVANKIRKIEELLGEKIDNASTQYKLLSSCLLAEYFEKYLGKQLTDKEVGGIS